ncbi:MAG: DUF47 family protein [Patescibacteria group bacterium]
MSSSTLLGVVRFVRRISFLPKDEQLYRHLQSMVDLIAVSSAELRLMINDGLTRDERNLHLREIIRAKTSGKQAQRTINDIVNRAVITPFPRQEITGLADMLQDILGSLKMAANLYFYFQVENPPDELRQMAEIVAASGQQIALIISPLQQFNHPESVYHAIEELESRADDIRAIRMPMIIFRATTLDELRRAYALMKVIEVLEKTTDILKGVTVKVKGVIDSHV